MSARRELTVAAAEMLACRGYADTDEHTPEDEELLAELAAVAAAVPDAASPTKLADYWIAQRQDAYERSIPTWTCDCGAKFKVFPRWPNDEEFHRVADDGLVGEFAGEIRRNSQGGLKHSSDCPCCGKSFIDTITRQADPQMSLF